MMKSEFEKIAGYEVSVEDYTKIIEPMYMATDLSKEDFVKVIDKKRFALKPLNKIVKEMRDCAKSLKETCTHYTDYETERELDYLIHSYMNRKYLGDNVSYYFEKEELWTCYYPKTVVICYGASPLSQVEKIKLI